MTKEMWIKRRMDWELALGAVARQAKQNSVLLKMLGSVAWGRYDGEHTAYEKKDNVVYGAGYLKGYRDALLQTTRVLKMDGERLLAEAHD